MTLSERDLSESIEVSKAASTGCEFGLSTGWPVGCEARASQKPKTS